MTELPDAVHRQLLRWAGAALGELPPERVPTALRPVAKFRPNRRVTLGAAALDVALCSDASFRASVAEYVRGLDIQLTGDTDLVERAAAARLWEHPDADELVAGAAAEQTVDKLRLEVGELRRQLQLATASAEPVTPVPAVDPVPPGTGTGTGRGPDTATDGTADRLRQRLREQGSALRAAKDAAAAADEQATVELKALRIAHDRAVAELRNVQERLQAEQARADRAHEALNQARADDRGTREAAHRRIELLLETMQQAGAGLRREWRLTTGGPDPADRVAASLSSPVATSVGDPTSVVGLLSLPQCHLIVDGYNVTKTGYPQLTLADQRDRLVREVAQLVARTAAEGTVVFDGAAVVVPQARHRGVRVLYSPAGVSADDVIRRLVAAEPAGRVLLVATADGEIISSVVRAGARTVTPKALLSAIQH